MIVRITGRVESASGVSAVLAIEGSAGGVAREVLVPAFLAASLATRVGDIVTLHTLEYLESRDQGASFVPRIVGFETVGERRLFELLTTVKGIGNRKALRAMAMEAGAIANAIASRDTTTLVRLPEVGKRLAETIIAELGGKLDELVKGNDVVEAKGGGVLSAAAEEAVAALVALGDPRADAERRVRRALQRDRTLSTADEIVSASLGA